jgi:hypothetical protein
MSTVRDSVAGMRFPRFINTNSPLNLLHIALRQFTTTLEQFLTLRSKFINKKLRVSTRTFLAYSRNPVHIPPIPTPNSPKTHFSTLNTGKHSIHTQPTQIISIPRQTPQLAIIIISPLLIWPIPHNTRNHFYPKTQNSPRTRHIINHTMVLPI